MSVSIETAANINDDNYKRRQSTDTSSVTVAASSSEGSSNSSGSSNIWNRLLSNESVWDSLNVIQNDNEDIISDYDYEEKRAWRPSGFGLVLMTAWYETRHFFKTMANHPHIWLVALAVGGIVAGVGMWAITNEKDAYVQDKMQTADFVARETATYFSNEFKRAFLPLYSLREGEYALIC